MTGIEREKDFNFDDDDLLGGDLNLDFSGLGYEKVSKAGEDTEKILEEIKAEAEKTLEEKITSLFENKEALAKKTKESEAAKELPEGAQIHNYMGFYDVLADGMKKEIEEETDAHVSVILASEQNPTWYHKVERVLEGEDETNDKEKSKGEVLLIVFSNDFKSTAPANYSPHTVDVKTNSWLQDHNDWKAIHKLPEDAKIPYEVNDKAWEEALDRITCLVRK